MEGIEITIDDNTVDIVFNDYKLSGHIENYNSGRSTEHTFSPSWYLDQESENWYSENWETIEELVINKFESIK